jgi:hypothetical protein
MLCRGMGDDKIKGDPPNGIDKNITDTELVITWAYLYLSLVPSRSKIPFEDRGSSQGS